MDIRHQTKDKYNFHMLQYYDLELQLSITNIYSKPYINYSVQKSKRYITDLEIRLLCLGLE